MKAIKSNEDFFEIIDSDIKAYLLGFFVADGNITSSTHNRNNSRMQIALTKDDEEIVKLFQEYICPNNNIRYTNYKKGAVNRRPVSSIRWTSLKMKNDLEKLYDIKPRKTYHHDFKFDFSKIPKEYHYSFIRGFFDGDGQISHTPSNNTITFGLYGTSKIFLEQIGEIIGESCNVKYIIDSSKKKNVTLYLLRFHSNFKRKEFITKLCKFFYTNTNNYLSRKKRKFESYLNTVLN